MDPVKVDSAAKPGIWRICLLSTSRLNDDDELGVAILLVDC